jgi:T5SS/PEP-CTERM-associated repeat protein
LLGLRETNDCQSAGNFGFYDGASGTATVDGAGSKLTISDGSLGLASSGTSSEITVPA